MPRVALQLTGTELVHLSVRRSFFFHSMSFHFPAWAIKTWVTHFWQKANLGKHGFWVSVSGFLALHIWNEGSSDDDGKTADSAMRGPCSSLSNLGKNKRWLYLIILHHFFSFKDFKSMSLIFLSIWDINSKFWQVINYWKIKPAFKWINLT